MDVKKHRNAKERKGLSITCGERKAEQKWDWDIQWDFQETPFIHSWSLG